MSKATIRRAGPADAQVLSAIGAATFTETFAHLYPPEDLSDFLAYAYGIDRIHADLADPAKAQWIVEANDQVVGYALAGPCDLPHPEVTPTCGELKRLYLLKSHQGGGTGRRLLDLTLDWLRQKGCSTLWIGVWSENFGAQRLYGRLGFDKVGEYGFPVGKTLDREFILRRLETPTG